MNDLSAPLNATQIKVRAIRAAIAELMGECTEQQRQFLHTIHDNAPWKGLANCPASKLDATYALLCRTVKENSRAREATHIRKERS